MFLRNGFQKIKKQPRERSNHLSYTDVISVIRKNNWISGYLRWCNSGSFILGKFQCCVIELRTHSKRGKPCLVL